MALNNRNTSTVFERVRDPAGLPIYLGRDNWVDSHIFHRSPGGTVQPYPVDRADSVVLYLMIGRIARYAVNTLLQPGVIDFSQGNGLIRWRLGDAALGIAEGEYRGRLIAFDANNVSGVTLFHENSQDGAIFRAVNS